MLTSRTVLYGEMAKRLRGEVNVTLIQIPSRETCVDATPTFIITIIFFFFRFPEHEIVEVLLYFNFSRSSSFHRI